MENKNNIYDYAPKGTKGLVIALSVIYFLSAGVAAGLVANGYPIAIIDMAVYTILPILLLKKKHWGISLAMTIYGALAFVIMLALEATSGGGLAIVLGIICTINLKKAHDSIDNEYTNETLDIFPENNSKIINNTDNSIILNILANCKYYIHLYENHDFPIYSCEKILLETVEDRLIKSAKEISSNKSINYIELTHSELANASYNLLASGKFHISKGTLNPKGPANNLMCVYKSCLNYEVENKILTEEGKKNELDNLYHHIAEAGNSLKTAESEDVFITEPTTINNTTDINMCDNDTIAQNTSDVKNDIYIDENDTILVRSHNLGAPHNQSSKKDNNMSHIKKRLLTLILLLTVIFDTTYFIIDFNTIDYCTNSNALIAQTIAFITFICIFICIMVWLFSMIFDNRGTQDSDTLCRLKKESKHTFITAILTAVTELLLLFCTSPIYVLLSDEYTTIPMLICIALLALFSIISLYFMLFYSAKIKMFENDIDADVRIRLNKDIIFYINSTTMTWQMNKRKILSRVYNLSEITNYTFVVNGNIIGRGTFSGNINELQIPEFKGCYIYITTTDISNCYYRINCSTEALYTLQNAFRIITSQSTTDEKTQYRTEYIDEKQNTKDTFFTNFLIISSFITISICVLLCSLLLLNREEVKLTTKNYDDYLTFDVDIYNIKESEHGIAYRYDYTIRIVTEQKDSDILFDDVLLKYNLILSEKDYQVEGEFDEEAHINGYGDHFAFFNVYRISLTPDEPKPEDIQLEITDISGSVLTCK